jgi:hypothetical protein
VSTLFYLRATCTIFVVQTINLYCISRSRDMTVRPLCCNLLSKHFVVTERPHLLYYLEERIKFCFIFFPFFSRVYRT